MPYLKYLIDVNNTLDQVLVSLENATPVNTLLVTSGKANKLVGTITDGDVRRRLIQGGDTTEPLSQCVNKNFYSVGAAVSNEAILKIFDTGKYKLLPKLDENGCIIDVITFDNLSVKDARIRKPLVRSRAPVRVSFCGGGSDMTSYFVENDGAVLSTTINLYARSTLQKRSDSQINIFSYDLEKSISFSALDSISQKDPDFALILSYPLKTYQIQ